jgi:hypothetical protein
MFEPELRGSTFVKLMTNFLSLLSKDKDQLHNPSPRSSLYNLYFMQWLCIYV